MSTSSPALTSEQLAPAMVSHTATPSTWLILAQAFARWAMWATIFVSGLIGLENNFGMGRLVSCLIMAFLGFAMVSLGDGIVSLLWKILGLGLRGVRLTAAATRLRTIPPAPIGRILGVFLYIAGDLLWPDTFFQHIMIPIVGELFIILMAVTGVLVTLSRFEAHTPQSRNLLRGTALVLNGVFLIWVFLPGTANGVAQAAAPTAPTAPPTLPNPGLPGPYAVQTLSYGSGDVTGRPEFSAKADLLTQPVDGSKIFSYPGLGGSYFRWYWDFDFTQLPLNGLVWYPEGEGPFPIVLIVHGNHAMLEPSDPGYAYLAEHLASHGYIAVSVDENYLNGMMFIDGGMAEMPLRAWLLLKHLQVWRTWNETADNPFYGQVDLKQVALIGHSRGGEAVAAAAQMNSYVAPPVSRVSSAREFGFGIAAVVSIAPSDGNYKPAGRPLTLPQSNYLLLAGGHDADTFVLYGQAQYNRVRFTDNPDGFKALAYVYQGNHGQFNSVWANRDRGWLNSLLLNRRPLLSGAEQQETAEVFITAFLEASLRGQDGYRTLFANPTAGNTWLPDTLIVTQYEAASFIAVDTNRANSAASRLDEPDGHTDVNGISTWETRPLFLRDGTTSQQNSALYLAWDAGSEPVVDMVLGDAAAITPDDAFTFALTTALDEATPINVFVELEAQNGQVTRLPLSQFGPVYPPLPAQLIKAEWLAPLPGYKITLETPFERVLQTYTLPLSAFQQANPAFPPEAIQVIHFLFDGTEAGAVYLDQVGFVAQE